MRYTPGHKEDYKTTSEKILYSNSKTLMMKDGSEYVGYYHLKNGIPYTGQSETLSSERLFAYNPDPTFIEYINLIGMPYYDETHPVKHTVLPKAFDYDNGYMTRYFVKKRNDKNSMIYEVDETQYNTLEIKDSGLNGDLYYGISLRWKLTGPINDIFDGAIIKIPGVLDTNERTVQKYNRLMPGIDSVLTNFTQYIRVSSK